MSQRNREKGEKDSERVCVYLKEIESEEGGRKTNKTRERDMEREGERANLFGEWNVGE